MAAVTVKQLLEAGVHFGHQTRRWNPKMAKYIFGERNGVYIVNLEKTENELNKACEFLYKVAAGGGYVLFVGTKKQAQQAILDESMNCEMFYVEQRWLGGTLTNFETIRKSVKRLNELEELRDNGTFDKLTKKEVALLKKEMSKLIKNLAGIRKMNRLPGALFVVDIKKEETAVKEARRLHIPIVALVDTNSDPDVVDYVIPGNDDAIKSIRLICSAISAVIAEGRKSFKEAALTAAKKEATREEKQEKEVAAKIEEKTASAKKVLKKDKKQPGIEPLKKTTKTKRKA